MYVLPKLVCDVPAFRDEPYCPSFSSFLSFDVGVMLLLDFY